MFPEHWPLSKLIRHFCSELLTDAKIIVKHETTVIKNQEKIMSALTDLQASVSKLSTDVNAFITANSGGATDADLVTLKASVDAIDAVVNPPTPAPAS